MLLFTNGSKGSIKKLWWLLEKYEDSSGQMISLEKSGFYTSKTIQEKKIHLLKEWSGFRHKKLSLRYLGVPIYKGRCSVKHFDYLVQQVQTRLTG